MLWGLKVRNHEPFGIVLRHQFIVNRIVLTRFDDPPPVNRYEDPHEETSLKNHYATVTLRRCRLGNPYFRCSLDEEHTFEYVKPAMTIKPGGILHITCQGFGTVFILGELKVPHIDPRVLLVWRQSSPQDYDSLFIERVVQELRD